MIQTLVKSLEAGIQKYVVQDQRSLQLWWVQCSIGIFSDRHPQAATALNPGRQLQGFRSRSISISTRGAVTFYFLFSQHRLIVQRDRYLLGGSIEMIALASNDWKDLQLYSPANLAPWYLSVIWLTWVNRRRTSKARLINTGSRSWEFASVACFQEYNFGRSYAKKRCLLITELVLRVLSSVSPANQFDAEFKTIYTQGSPLNN